MVGESPQRTCIGCRVRTAKFDLLRVVVVGAACVPDRRSRLPGRGAHLHPDLACLALAERRRAFPRALRRPGSLDTEAVRRHLEFRGAGRLHDEQQPQAAQAHPEALSSRKRVETRMSPR